jgi:hypothetical protein
MITSVALLTAMWMVGPQPWDGTWTYDKPQYVATAPVLPQPAHHSTTLPPVEYDHPYSGKLYVSAENTREGVLTACGFRASDKRIIFGCAKVIGFYVPGGPQLKEGMIVLAERKWVEQTTDYDDLVRHEIGHCNGWRH